MRFVAGEIHCAYKLLVLVGDGQNKNFIRVHGRNLGQNRHPESQAHILKGGVALPYLKDDVGDDTVQSKNLIQVRPEIASPVPA